MLDDELLGRIRAIVPQSNLIENDPLSKYTTFRIGGPARLIIEIDDVKLLSEVLALLSAGREECFILGNGSNTLASDLGYDGVILHVGDRLSGIRCEGNLISACAGAKLIKVARIAQENGLSGLEFAAGIPGTVGGGIFMNAGAYGGEMCQVTESVKAVKMDGTPVTLLRDELEFGYRTSVFKKGGLVITEATFSLSSGDPAEIKSLMEEYNQRRRDKQPLEYPSAGSTFKRPEGYFAGKLIMDSGMRGYQTGGARVSDKHCGFVINVGNATAADVMDVINTVQDMVIDRFGVKLEPEIVMLGQIR